jgi:hypothetical protein
MGCSSLTDGPRCLRLRHQNLFPSNSPLCVTLSIKRMVCEGAHSAIVPSASLRQMEGNVEIARIDAGGIEIRDPSVVITPMR